MIPRKLAPGPQPLEVVVFDVPELGDRSYLLHDGTVAVVVDAQRDTDAYLAQAESLGITIRLVVETHIHNDYVSGGLALSEEAGARYVIPRFEAVGFAGRCDTAGEGDVMSIGSIVVRALATPGHSAHHLSYVIEHRDEDTSFVATGGSLLHGTTGRTDLFGARHAGPLALAQWRSVRRLLRECRETAIVLPTHGFGSFCAAAPPLATSEMVTIGAERAQNRALELGAEAFVTELTNSPLPIPAYYGEIGTLNRAGQPAARIELPSRIDAACLDELVSTAQTVVDLRPRRSFAAEHRLGTLNFELGTSLATYLGWLVPAGTPMSLVAADEASVREAQRILAHIGREDVAAWCCADTLFARSAPSSYPVVDFRALAEARSAGIDHLLVDVRHGHEWTVAHLEGAEHVALPDLPARLAGLPHDVEVFVHCAAGYRAAIAASMLESDGGRPVLIDDDFGRARSAGLPIVEGDGARLEPATRKSRASSA